MNQGKNRVKEWLNKVGKRMQGSPQHKKERIRDGHLKDRSKRRRNRVEEGRPGEAGDTTVDRPPHSLNNMY